jgi:hypothetical protein
MPTSEYYNGQISPSFVPKTGPHLQLITKTVLGCQKTNGINPRSAIVQQQPHKVIRISRQTSNSTDSDRSKVENVEYFNYLGSTIINYVSCTCQNRKDSFHQQFGIKFKEDINTVLHFEHTFV